MTGQDAGPPRLQLNIGQFSDPGRKRTNNEDWLGAFQPEDPEQLAAKGRLFLVADGMGGHQSGEKASRRAVDHVIRSYMSDRDADVATSLERAFQSANDVLGVDGSAQKKGRRWGTTLVAALVKGDRVWIANVGDSRAYLLRGNHLQQLSQDHSWAASGSDADFARDWIGRNVITRALGLKAKVEIDVFAPLRLRVGDRILLCTDGLTTPVPEQEIAEIMTRTPPQQAAEGLVRRANELGGPDNISVILIQVTGASKAPLGRELGEFFRPLAEPETWRQAARELEQSVFGARAERHPADSRPSLLIVVAILIVLVLIGAGFVLGLILFR